MTFAEIVDRVCKRLNLTSGDARVRVGETVNDVYKKITTSIGLNVTRHAEVQANADISSQFVTFDGVEKVNTVIDKSSGANRILDEVTLSELDKTAPALGDTPRKYAIYRVYAGSVQIKTDAVAQTAYTLYAPGFERAETLSGDLEPAFSESFHDILVIGTLEEEYTKQEKVALADRERMKYEDRMGDLRIFIAKSPQQDIYQGKAKSTTFTGSASGGGGSSVNGATSYTQTGLITFDRDPSAPFAVTSGSAKVTNLNADLLDGEEGTAFHALANATGTLAVANGGTGQTTVIAAFDALSPLTTQGDLLYNDGTHDVRLPKNASATRYLSNAGASNNPAWAQIDLTNGVAGDLPFSSLAQGFALSVLGVTGNALADVASITAGSDGQVLRRSGTAVAFGAVALDVAAAITGVLPVANFTKIVASSTTGTLNNFDPSSAISSGKNVIVFMTNASLATITGLAAGAVNGQMVLIKPTNTQVDAVHQSGSSSASNRLTNHVTSAATSAAAEGHFLYVYDLTNTAWRLVHHEQGGWITPTYSGGNYTPFSAGTWTVASGDVSVNKYRLAGRTLSWMLKLITTTVAQSGGQPTLLVIAPAAISPYTISDNWRAPGLLSDNGTQQLALFDFNGSNVLVSKVGATQFANATDTTEAAINTSFQVI